MGVSRLVCIDINTRRRTTLSPQVIEILEKYENRKIEMIPVDRNSTNSTHKKNDIEKQNQNTNNPNNNNNNIPKLSSKL